MITGATSGIGRETAREFARAGARVVTAGRRKSQLQELISEIETTGGEALAVQTDVAEQPQVERLIEKAELGNHLVKCTNSGSTLPTPSRSGSGSV